jgi:arabinogalactan endo-1,4-beta-galactosidase
MLMASATTFAQKYVGGDISMLTKYEDAGVVYKDKDGNAVQPLTFFKEQGLNAMRVRLFVDPSLDNDKAVCQDLEYVKALGKRIKDAGHKFMLDFHYSDTWADPGKQWTPDAWKTLNDEALATKLYEYTKSCLEALKAAGAEPDFIQTGNEISYGMLWGVAGTTANRCYTNSPDANWNRFFSLLNKAGAACREICPNAKIIIHSERVGAKDVLIDYFDRIKTASIDYDIIGLSYYPAYHGDLATLEGALRVLEERNYGKDIMIVETGYCYAWALDGTTFDYTATYPYTEEGQRQFTADLITSLNKYKSVKGLFWWWMEDNGNKGVTNKWWNAALYNHNTGKPYAAFYELKNFGLKGDVNGDGEVGIGDIISITNVMAGDGTEEANNRADVNGDGEVGIGDIISITNIMAGKL